MRTREVAAAVGLSWPALVLRFGGKQALFTRAVSDPLARPLEAGLVSEDSDLREMLEQLTFGLHRSRSTSGTRQGCSATVSDERAEHAPEAASTARRDEAHSLGVGANCE